jgi:ribose 5-phosphate isomerase B
MKIFLGSDHNGYHLKEKLFAYLAKHGYEVEDVGDRTPEPSDDFTDFAQAAALKVLGEEGDPRAILLCGGGQGMAMAANRFRGIRASVVWDAYEAKMTRNDNDSNILCIPSRIFDETEDSAWQGILETWLNTPFADAPRYRRRNAQLDEL